MAWVLIVLAVIAFLVLAIRQSPLWQWALAALAIGLLAMLRPEDGLAFSGNVAGWIMALLPALVLALLAVPAIRRLAVTGPAYGMVQSILPRISRTEQEALDAGTVGWDAEIFSGRPDWNRLFAIRKPALSAEEQAFLDGATEEVCRMIDDWDTRHNRMDLTEEVWQFLKDKGFFGMLIGKEHGGLGFSAQAQSQVVSRIASRSVAAGITVMVPNSLGPGELLEKYGTPAQQGKYLHRLARGEEIPCFALTGPHAGSDAAGMPDVGVVTYGEYEGEQVLGVRLSWDKRYITLAPVATLLGIAFNLHDPDNHLGKGAEIGITLALVPADYPGVEIGRRHLPARSAFMNGPTSGKDVFIPLDFLIGGPDYAGQGWRMLMECLATGRAISLPAIGTVSIKAALRVTSAYARIRRQFGIPIGQMEGVGEGLARLVKSAYQFEASRAMTAAIVDDGQKPAVISAALKYRTTAEMRDRVDDAMDIQGGRAVQDGPSNYLFSGYQTVPVAITVEGANILTRTLITFAQGALRAHPYLLEEVRSAQNPDKRQGLVDFDRAFSGHVGFMLRNMTASWFHGITLGRFASSPVEHELKIWYRALHRYAQSFALAADWTVAFLGGDLKRKQMLSGRMADVFSDLYLLSAALKRYEDDGRMPEDIPVIDAIARDRIAAIETGLGGVIDNFPHPLMRFALGVLIFPLGRRARPARDKANYRLALSVLAPSAFRDRLTCGVHVSFDPADPVGRLEDALAKVVAAEEVERKFFRALKKGEISRRLDRDAIADAVERQILSPEEARILRAADQATEQAIKVDDFAADALARPVRQPDQYDSAAE
ncbi:acyl-CoA dehydrogenase [Pelagibacterium lacus]|uniref:Acyl-coenzyme A dehydrogenase n=1 Tax=Pelagibacterium lacus TaxID=2282655 RepID=A0A369W059_9HYPH|nr:acyl-CoA dehydrogenase [Pelagibacterium lacus]RDE08026.1 acyl-CoA dehydrogenase [Pelagibacterium lacus]